jgi:hypothetical protein
MAADRARAENAYPHGVISSASLTMAASFHRPGAPRNPPMLHAAAWPGQLAVTAEMPHPLRQISTAEELR